MFWFLITFNFRIKFQSLFLYWYLKNDATKTKFKLLAHSCATNELNFLKERLNEFLKIKTQWYFKGSMYLKKIILRK